MVNLKNKKFLKLYKHKYDEKLKLKTVDQVYYDIIPNYDLLITNLSGVDDLIAENKILSQQSYLMDDFCKQDTYNNVRFNMALDESELISFTIDMLINCTGDIDIDSPLDIVESTDADLEFYDEVNA